MNKFAESISFAPLLAALGAFGGALTAALGGWDTGLVTLVIFMAVDYITGLIVAGVFRTSTKSESGALESRAGWKGLCRKGMTLLVVLVAAQLDRLTGNSFIRDSVVIGYTANEALSIIENAGLMGVPIPGAVSRAIDTLRGKEKK